MVFYSIHWTLAHFAQLVRDNDGYGIAETGENTLEGSQVSHDLAYFVNKVLFIKDTNRKIRTTFSIYIYATNYSSNFEFSRVFHIINVLKRSHADNNKVDLTQVNVL